MTTELTQVQIAEGGAMVPVVTEDQLQLVKNTVAKGATDEELKLFLYDCQRRGVHPLDKLLHFTKRSGRYTPITSIDLLRSRAAATGQHAGTDDAVFVGSPPMGRGEGDELAKEVLNQSFSATVTVYRLVGGQRFAFTATARWAEYYPGPGSEGFMWRKLPYTMLAKVAESVALRKGFPAELAGLYAQEEMDQAGGGPAWGAEVQKRAQKALALRPPPSTPPAPQNVPERQSEAIAGNVEIVPGQRGPMEEDGSEGKRPPSERPAASKPEASPERIHKCREWWLKKLDAMGVEQATEFYRAKGALLTSETIYDLPDNCIPLSDIEAKQDLAELIPWIADMKRVQMAEAEAEANPDASDIPPEDPDTHPDFETPSRDTKDRVWVCPDGVSPEDWKHWITDAGWRTLEIHFGNNKGVKLEDIDSNKLFGWVMNFEPKPFKGKLNAKDVQLRNVLDLLKIHGRMGESK